MTGSFSKGCNYSFITLVVGNGSDLACGDVSIKLLPRFWQIALKVLLDQ